MRARGIGSRIALIGSIVAVAVAPLPASAQSAARVSSITRGVLTSILDVFAPILAATATEATDNPWELYFPTDTLGVDWPLVREAVARVLRARPPQRTDRNWLILRVTSVALTTEVTRVQFAVVGKIRCAEGFTGSSTTWEISFPASAVPYWPHPKAIQFSDGLGCDPPVPWPPRKAPLVVDTNIQVPVGIKPDRIALPNAGPARKP
jgi:hypothetical protein